MSFLGVMTTLIQLFSQTINNTEECLSETRPWMKKLHWTRSWLPVLHRRQWNAFLFYFFNFLLYSMKMKCFYVLCKWFLHVVWQAFFAIFFFFSTKEKRYQKRTKTITNKAKHGRLTFIWKNIWMQNLPEGVDRFFFFNRKSDVKR